MRWTILCLALLTVLFTVTWVINDELTFRKESIIHINYLYKRIGGNVNKPILIPNYLHQSVLTALPNQSAYVPFIFKDEESVKDYYKIQEWDNKATSYYDFNSIYKKGG